MQPRTRVTLPVLYPEARDLWRSSPLSAGVQRKHSSTLKKPLAPRPQALHCADWSTDHQRLFHVLLISPEPSTEHKFTPPTLTSHHRWRFVNAYTLVTGHLKLVTTAVAIWNRPKIHLPPATSTVLPLHTRAYSLSAWSLVTIRLIWFVVIG